MALLDVQATFADRQAVTATAFGSNFYDLTSDARNVGRAGQRIKFFTNVAPTAAGAATVTFELINSDNADGTGNTTVLAASGAVPIASLPLGSSGFDIAIPDTNRRYLGVRFTVGTGPLTAGQFTASVVGEGGSSHQRSYRSGYPSPVTG